MKRLLFLKIIFSVTLALFEVLSAYSFSNEDIVYSITDVYVTGSYYNEFFKSIPCYWKNGHRMDLSLSTDLSDGYATHIILGKNDIYVLGAVFIENEYINCCWKNDEIIALVSIKNKGEVVGFEISPYGELFIISYYEYEDGTTKTSEFIATVVTILDNFNKEEFYSLTGGKKVIIEQELFKNDIEGSLKQTTITTEG